MLRGCCAGCSGGAVRDAPGDALKGLGVGGGGAPGRAWGLPGSIPNEGCSWGCSWGVLSPSSCCLGAATDLSHPGQERFQGTLGCGMEALGGGERAGRLPVLVGSPGCHRVRAGKGPPPGPGRCSGNHQDPRAARVAFKPQNPTVKPSPAVKMWFRQAPAQPPRLSVVASASLQPLPDSSPAFQPSGHRNSWPRNSLPSLARFALRFSGPCVPQGSWSGWREVPG